MNSSSFRPQFKCHYLREACPGYPPKVFSTSWLAITFPWSSSQLLSQFVTILLLTIFPQKEASMKKEAVSLLLMFYAYCLAQCLACSCCSKNAGWVTMWINNKSLKNLELLHTHTWKYPSSSLFSSDHFWVHFRLTSFFIMVTSDADLGYTEMHLKQKRKSSLPPALWQKDLGCFPPF